VTDQLKQIAARIRELREVSDVSMESLANELDIPLETYQEFETGNSDIPVSFLYQIANRFNVELTAILTGGNPKLHTYSLARRGKGVAVERRKEYDYQSLAFNFVRKHAEPFLVAVEPKPDDAPFELNSHPGQEFNYVLKGTLKVVMGDHELVLHEGDSLYFDSHCPHGMKAVGDGPAEFLAIIL
jgi:quercetin dioxygenase-like cupin family protein/DNA-binding XRE family transcriptional regulator